MLALLASYAFVGQLTEPGAFGELFDVRSANSSTFASRSGSR